jgi:phosphate transport system substrate-binding protein
VHFQRKGQVALVVAAASLSLVLAACDSNNDSSSSGPSASIACATGTLNAAGSTAQANAITQWTKNYQEQCTGATINYNSNGSGAGLTSFTQGKVDFAGSDTAMTAAQIAAASARCNGGTALNLPMVVGPIAVGYNLSGVTNLQLSADTIAGIFNGSITNWNDGKIAADNPGVTLPNVPIQTFHRSDSSGTTDNFTKYLTNAAPTVWTFGHDKVWKATGGQGVKGSDQVAANVKSTAGSIGYMEWSYAVNSGIPTAKIKNGAGQYQDISAEAAGETIAGATVVGTNGDLALSINYTTTQSGAYPLVLVTYELVCSKGLAASQAALVKSFMTYISSTDGQNAIASINYGTLPSSIQTKVAAAVASLA